MVNTQGKLPIKYKVICNHCGKISFTAAIPTQCINCGAVFNNKLNDSEKVTVALKGIIYNVQQIRLSEIKPMEKTLTIIEGKVKRDVFGSWSDCSPGLFLDTDNVETIFGRYEGKNIKVTIEVISEVKDNE